VTLNLLSSTVLSFQLPPEEHNDDEQVPEERDWEVSQGLVSRIPAPSVVVLRLIFSFLFSRFASISRQIVLWWWTAKLGG
jgi:hypothetical protein